LCLFLWTLIGSARRIVQSFSNGTNVRLAGLFGGLTAFAITMLISNPLMVHATSYVFWIALGLATGAAGADNTVRTSNEQVTPQSRWTTTTAIALCAGLIVASVPFR